MDDSIARDEYPLEWDRPARLNAPASLTPGVGEDGHICKEPQDGPCVECCSADHYQRLSDSAPAVVTEGGTPQTDEAVHKIIGPGTVSINAEGWQNRFGQLANHARRLERELTAANAERDKANATIERLSGALKRIANAEDAPEIDPCGEIQFGLYCGVEDRGCSDRYEGADFGFAEGSSRMIDWAINEAKAAITPKEDGRAG